ncbi:MAG TPA: hypothetical protein VFR03_10825 [Thermoanaerobaculia bacterium]|nr:hypothetical protein [Thermoanaerobaculia bacterium]
MEVILATLTVPDLAAALRQGSSHPLLGPFLAGGSYCPVDAGLREILDAARETEGLTILGDPVPEDLRRTGERAVLCLLVDGGGARPLAILYGRSLPVLGAIPACTVEDLRTTWAALAGGAPRGGRHLLHEQPEAWDPRIERQLTQRLRQLYGE